MDELLWFDDELGYTATEELSSSRSLSLWFDDELGYTAT